VPEQAEQQSKRMRREDPSPRPVEQLANRGELDNQDPSKHYVWVDERNSDPTFNVSTYKALGYKVAQFDPQDEAMPSIGWNDYKPGDQVRSMGMVLMECSKALKDQRDRKGWEDADRIQDTIRNREVDPLSPQERAAFRGITTARHGDDTRSKWQF
jgi:hypothetical protein